MRLLDGSIRGYAWGSRTAIAQLQGRPTPSPGPEAELWLGAHPGAPSLLHGRAHGPGTADEAQPLNAVIAGDPAGVLGARTVAQFGERLPFLLKVLAAARPLSLQAHPDLAQARAGHAAEEAAATDPTRRNYGDPWHKPELLVAVEPFDALCGFREPGVSAGLLDTLDVPALKPTVDALRADDPGRALRDAVQGLLSLPVGRREPVVADVAAAAAGRAAQDPAYALAVMLAREYPGDLGVVVAMLLNHVTLQPGEAVWMPAGNLHAYLRGVGVEIMAASDNVLRGGLTGKHVDVGELLHILRFEVLQDPVVRPQPVAPGVVTWPVPVPDFALHRAVLSADGRAVRLPGSGPRIVLCLRGSVLADDGEAAVPLRSGQAAFAGASASGVEVRAAGGEAEVYQASTGG